MATELAYRYAAPSRVGADGAKLATSGLVEAPEPYFTGVLRRPDVAAAGLLCVARVARTRFYVAPGSADHHASMDPVVTSESGTLRFESFSACCGVHARLDITGEGLGADSWTPGTVNVDFNDPMRAALARVLAQSALRLQVGFDAVEVQTGEGAAVERRVALPDRWVKGFSEVQVASSRLPRALELDRVHAQRFIRSLPKGRAGRESVWAQTSSAGVRLVSRAGDGAVHVAAAERLRVLESVARHVESLVVYAVPDGVGTSVWMADLGDARLLVTLSPHFSRGFSGEGGLLDDLADETLGIEAEFLDGALHGRWRVDSDALAATGMSADRAQRALSWLGAHGRLGYDPVEEVWFRRELPFPRASLLADPPRLRDAKRLVATDAVMPAGDGAYDVRSGDSVYVVRLDPPRCTCPWWSKHPGDRGPCKHLLAAQLARLHRL